MVQRHILMLQPDAFCEYTMQQNATAAGALPRIPLGELTDPLAGLRGPLCGREGEGEEWVGRGGEAGGRRGVGWEVGGKGRKV